MGVQIKFTSAVNTVQKKHIDELIKGDVYMNSKHDPDNPPQNAGLYLVVNSRAACGGFPHRAFAVSLRGTAYTYDEIRKHTLHCKGMVNLFDIEILAAVKRR